MPEPLRLDNEDLYSPRVDAFLEERESLARGMPDIPPQPLVLRIIYSSYFYLSIAGALGALAGWALFEPFIDDNELPTNDNVLAWLLFFPTVAGCIGLFLGAVEGLMCRNPQRALVCAVVGLGIGFGGGLVSAIVGGLIFGLIARMAFEMGNPAPGQLPTGFAFLVLMLGRAAGWSVIAIPVGLGQGIALRERKVVLNGLLGGVLGGLLGGMLFDPIYLVLTSDDGQATYSRAVGFALIGLFVGLFIGLVEQWTKTAWVLMRAGPLAGKQFVIYRNPTVIGSSPKADIYLFKDEAIEPRHALIHNRGGRYEIEDCDTPDGTYVNGIPVRRRMLQPGDQIVMGKTVLEFLLKDTQ